MNSVLLAFVLASAGWLAPASAADPEPTPELIAAAERIRAEAGAHRLILLGEMHGTREAPQLASRLVANYAAKEPVVLALELDSALSPVFAAYLASDGGPKARAAVLAPSYWRVEPRRSDGRRNLEVIAMLEELRQLRARGADVKVIGMDDVPADPGAWPARNPAMAARVQEAFAAMPRGRLLTLSGNAHAMKERPSYAPPEMSVPMGSFLARLDPFAVDIVARGGSYWACRLDMEHCSEAEVPEGFQFSERPHEGDVFDLRVVLPTFSLAPLIPAEAGR